MHERDRLAALLDRVLDRGADQALRPGLGDRLDADAGVFADVPAELLLQDLDQPLRLGRAFLDLETGVDVFGVLPEDHHVDLLGVLHRRRHALEPAHRAQAHVEVEELAQRDVERPDTAADRRGERALDADQVVAERVDGLVGEPRAGRVERLLAREHLFPRDRLAVLRRRGVHDELRGGPDVDAGAVALDEGDDRLVGNRRAHRWTS